MGRSFTQYWSSTVCRAAARDEGSPLVYLSGDAFARHEVSAGDRIYAITVRDGRVLLARRPPHKHLALKWEFPGGKVEPGEEPVAALAPDLQQVAEDGGFVVAITNPESTILWTTGSTQMRARSEEHTSELQSH